MKTSTAAYLSQFHNDKRGKDAAKVLKAIEAAGASGLTNDEGEEATNLVAGTYIARRKELVDEGLVFISGRRRQTKNGRSADVIVGISHVTPEERAFNRGYHVSLIEKQKDYQLAKHLRPLLRVLRDRVKEEHPDIWGDIVRLVKPGNWPLPKQLL